MSTDALRAAIEAAMRRRDPKAIAMMFDCDVADVDRMIAKSMGASPDEDLAPIAALIGLCPDGSDPAEEVERLTRELAEARAALREYAARCEGHECDEIATRREPYSYGARACDVCITKYTSQPEDLPHAAALRAAGGSR